MTPTTVPAAAVTAASQISCGPSGWHRPARSAILGAMPTVEPCPGSCNTRWREAYEAFKQALDVYEREGILDPDQSRPELPSIHPIQGDPVWCGRCASRIRSSLADLDELAAMLGWVADGHAASAGSDAGRVSGTAETMSPSDAADELADLMNVLTEHENAYREQVLAIGTPPRRGFLAATSTQCIAWLGHHLDDILTSAIAEGFGADVLAWHKVWKRQAKAGARKLTKPMRCPSCQLLMLVWTKVRAGSTARTRTAGGSCRTPTTRTSWKRRPAKVPATATRKPRWPRYLLPPLDTSYSLGGSLYPQAPGNPGAVFLYPQGGDRGRPAARCKRASHCNGSV